MCAACSQRIVRGDAREGLRDHRIVALDVGALIAGARYRGEFLLQVLDDGRLTDRQGRTVDFKNTVIIMTSIKDLLANVVAHAILYEGMDGYEEGRLCLQSIPCG